VPVGARRAHTQVRPYSQYSRGNQPKIAGYFDTKNSAHTNASPAPASSSSPLSIWPAR
jgi:hypothetical protein